MDSRQGISVDEIQEQLLDYIAETFVVEKSDIDVSRSLVQTGIIDSIGLVEIASFMEKAFLLRVGAEDMTRANFGSVAQMAAFVRGKLSANGQGTLRSGSVERANR
jgi:acyl carrier protein